ncbi:hypothetical protein OFB61_25615, partial [Escherichia coli]|nr:hypothetical protein [Escherichia coli]
IRDIVKIIAKSVIQFQPARYLPVILNEKVVENRVVFYVRITEGLDVIGVPLRSSAVFGSNIGGNAWKYISGKDS